MIVIPDIQTLAFATVDFATFGPWIDNVAAVDRLQLAIARCRRLTGGVCSARWGR
jgi:hypothetical protein